MYALLRVLKEYEKNIFNTNLYIILRCLKITIAAKVYALTSIFFLTDLSYCSEEKKSTYAVNYCQVVSNSQYTY